MVLDLLRTVGVAMAIGYTPLRMKGPAEIGKAAADVLMKWTARRKLTKDQIRQAVARMLEEIEKRLADD